MVRNLIWCIKLLNLTFEEKKKLNEGWMAFKFKEIFMNADTLVNGA